VTTATEAVADGSDRSEPGQVAPHEQLGAAFKAAMAAVRRLRGRDTHRHDALSHAQYGLLFGLCDGSALSARDLAESAELSAATVAQMLESLEAAGLVQRTRSETDKRVVLTSLTPRGRDVIDERRARVEPRWRAALGEFSSEELRTAAAVLTRLADYFDHLEDPLETRSRGRSCSTSGQTGRIVPSR
jgi:MarR family transcriptional regulator, organic hydroperoxide resistance regulator